MTDKRLILTGLIISLTVISVFGMSLGGVNGQILSENTYYNEDFEEYNDSSIELSSDDNLRNGYLTNTSKWEAHDAGHIYNHDGIKYGDADVHRRTYDLDTRQPFLSSMIRGDHDHIRVGAERTIPTPEGVSDPTLVVEHAQADHDDSNFYDYEIAVDSRVYTTRAYDKDPGYRFEQTWSDVSRDDFNKVGWVDRTKQQSWKTTTFDVNPAKENVTFRTVRSGNDGHNHDPGVYVRQIYWRSGGMFQPEIAGWEALPEDDSFGGPDPYDLRVVTEPTADGPETKLRSHRQTITREFTLEGIEDAQSAYFVLNARSNSQYPVEYTIEAFGQEQASGSIDPQSSSEETVELDLNTDEVTVTIESQGQYDVNQVQFTALEQTSQGDPLAKNSRPGGITLSADSGYDRVINVLVAGLDLTTDMLLYIVMIAITLGFMVFSFTKSVRGQEFAQSLLFGAIVAGVVIVGVVPTMNLATWVFSGQIDRAPLADPALEAEPPTYYSTEFQDGTMHGWSFDNARGQGSARPVSVGESFDVQFQGTGSEPGIIEQQTHISLGNSLSTGFVEVDAAANSVAGYNQNPHEVTYNIRVYVTRDETLENSQKLDPNTNYVENDQSARELRNPVTEITNVEATVGGETRDLSNDFTIVHAGNGEIRYEGNQTLANNESYSETLSNPTIRYTTHNDGERSDSPGELEPGDTFTVSKSQTSKNIVAVEEVARSFNGETMSNEMMVTFPLNGEYVHTELIVRSNRDDENPEGTLTSVRVGATTEGGSTE